jgi:hypothetical protein
MSKSIYTLKKKKKKKEIKSIFFLLSSFKIESDYSKEMSAN